MYRQFEHDTGGQFDDDYLPRFSKITKQDIKDWLNNNEIENTELKSEALISLYLNEINNKDLYYKEVEGGLNNMLDRSNN